MTDEVDHDQIPWFGNDQGPTREAVEEMLADQGRSRGRERIVAELARMSADLVDSAVRAQDARIWLAASQRLMILVDKRSKDGAGIQEELFAAIEEGAE